MFFFGFIEAFNSKGIITNTLKMDYVSHGIRCNLHFRYLTEKILFTLQVY